MDGFKGLSGLRFSTIFLAGLSLSIGWGIRGNFGHEYGAMIPGALTAIVVCLLSGREDWRDRVVYFGMFGALGWAFGGSMSYMQVVAYTHSGDLLNQHFGFFGLFLIGFLWAAMGGAGTAFPAVVGKEQLTAIFKPICWVFLCWVVFNKFLLLYFETLFPGNYDSTWSRQAAYTYWFDADWMETTAALIALLAFELWDNRKGHFSQVSRLPLAACLLIYTAFGLLLQFYLTSAGLGIAQLFLEVPAETAANVASYAWLIGGVVGAVTGLGAYFFRMESARIWLLPVSMVVFALVGGLAHVGLQVTGLDRPLAAALIQYQVSQDYVITSATHLLTEASDETLAAAESAALVGTAETGLVTAAMSAFEEIPELGTTTSAQRAWAIDQVLSDQLINWPNVVLFFPNGIGWFVGALLGLAIYFFRFGRFGSGASLLLHMCLGWLGCFLLFPVLLGHPFFDGDIWFRMTPPRGDNWAGILGVVSGTAIWLLRNNYVPVLYAMLVSGILGGLGFSGGQLIKLMGLRPGNREVTADPSVVAEWVHWNSANWHSILEQTYGFLNGVGIAVAMGLLAARVGRNDGAPTQRRWTKVFAVAFVLFGVTYLNMFKNVLQWVKDDALPAVMAMPLVDGVEWSAAVWFNIVFGFAALVGIFLLSRHIRQPVALVPTTALGKGQLLYLAFLATVTVMNFERALAGFGDGRLVTEGVIFINAIVATLLIVTLPREGKSVPRVGLVDYGPAIFRTVWLGMVALLVATLGMTWVTRGLYGAHYSGFAGEQYRFGEKATWKIMPTEKSKKHS